MNEREAQRGLKTDSETGELGSKRERQRQTEIWRERQTDRQTDNQGGKQTKRIPGKHRNGRYINMLFHCP